MERRQACRCWRASQPITPDSWSTAPARWSYSSRPGCYRCADSACPALVHLGLEPGKDFIADDVGWPPSGDKKGQVLPFAGARIASGGPRVNILYSVAAPRIGDYADAGIRVSVLVGGSPATVDVLSAAGTCVVSKKNQDLMCPQSFQNRLQQASQ